jgi:hypothetical protein
MIDKNVDLASLSEYLNSRLTGDREYVNTRFNAIESAHIAAIITQQTSVSAALASAQREINVALAAQQRETSKAEIAMEKRFDGVNGFREALSDNARLMMPRSEAEMAFKQMNEKIDSTSRQIHSRQDQGAGKQQLWGTILGAISLIVAMAAVAVAFFIKQ